MRLPKTVIIDGYQWKVTVDAKSLGGCFDTGKKEITVGGKLKNEMVRTFLHEVLEAILTTRGARYQMYNQSTNDRLLFSFYHYEFENISNDLALALKDIIKPYMKEGL